MPAAFQADHFTGYADFFELDSLATVLMYQDKCRWAIFRERYANFDTNLS